MPEAPLELGWGTRLTAAPPRVTPQTPPAPLTARGGVVRRHGDPLPIFVPGSDQREPLGRDLPRYLRQRLGRARHREERVDGVLRALNELYVGPPRPSDGGRRAAAGRGPLTATQTSVRSRVGARVAECGDMPSLSQHEALFELLRSRDFYNLEPQNLGRYDYDKVTILTAGVKTLDAAGVLPMECHEFIKNPVRHVLRSAADIEQIGAVDSTI